MESFKLDRSSTRDFKAKAVRNYIILATVILVGFGWTQGTFDNFLWRVHLNYNTCAQNGFGAVFCGDALKEYKQRIGQQP